jgi:hypothetical protein
MKSLDDEWSSADANLNRNLNATATASASSNNFSQQPALVATEAPAHINPDLFKVDVKKFCRGSDDYLKKYGTYETRGHRAHSGYTSGASSDSSYRRDSSYNDGVRREGDARSVRDDARIQAMKQGLYRAYEQNNGAPGGLYSKSVVSSPSGKETPRSVSSQKMKENNFDFVNVPSFKTGQKWNVLVKFSLFAMVTSIVLCVLCFYFGYTEMQSGNTERGEVAVTYFGHKYQPLSEVERGQQKVLYGFAFLLFGAFFFHQGFYSSTFGLFRKKDDELYVLSKSKGKRVSESAPLLPHSLKSSGLSQGHHQSSLLKTSRDTASSREVTEYRNSNPQQQQTQKQQTQAEFFQMNDKDSTYMQTPPISANWNESLLQHATQVDREETQPMCFNTGAPDCAAPCDYGSCGDSRQTCNRVAVGSGAVVEDYGVGSRFVPTSTSYNNFY